MRVSVRKNDPGYRNDIETQHCEVYLNGYNLHNCFTADEEQGVVFIYDEIRPGLYANVLRDGEIVPAEGFRRGHVVIKRN